MASTIFRAPDPLSYDSLQTMIKNWRIWLKQFNIFLTATEYAAKDDKVKVNMFLNLIGPQGTDLYESFTWVPETDSNVLEKVIEKFETHINKNKNVTVNRYAFFNFHQKDEQTIDDYIKGRQTKFFFLGAPYRWFFIDYDHKVWCFLKKKNFLGSTHFPNFALKLFPKKRRFDV